MLVSEYKKKFIELLVQEKKNSTNELKFSKSKSNLRGLVVENLNTASAKITIKLKLNRDTDIYSLKVGESYLIYSEGKEDEDLTGVLTSISNQSITITTDRVKNYLYSKTLNLAKTHNDVSYKRMVKVLDKLESVSTSAVKVRDILLGNDRSVNWNDIKSIEYFDTGLNDSQKKAVLDSVNESSFFLVQGPPGTGKTRVAKELIEQFLKMKKRVLVCCDSNLAVDNILKQFDNSKKFLRLGQNYKFDNQIKHFTFDFKISLDARNQIIQKRLQEVGRLRDEKKKFLMPSRQLVGDLNYLQICKLADSGRNFKGIDNTKLTSMKNWIVLQNRMRKHLMQIDKTKSEILSDLLKNHDAIFSTNVNSFEINNVMFDVCIIDEASQATQPSVLIPALKAKKVILIGDHKQLPPTTQLKDSDLSISFFEKLIEKNSFVTLDTQYRMHESICKFISNQFYDNKLKTQVNVELDESYIYDKHMVFIDHKGIESSPRHSRSKINEREAELVIEQIQKYNQKGFDLSQIGVISPYLDQCHLINLKLKKLGLEQVKVNTVDSYQGHQMQVIILSLVRSNENANLGFLEDIRRLNVSISRAINQLIVIANKATIINNSVYKDLVDYIGENGLLINAD